MTDRADKVYRPLPRRRPWYVRIVNLLTERIDHLTEKAFR